MIPLSLATIAEIVGGRVHAGETGPADPAGLVVDGAAYVDTRAAVAGGLFVAVVGERTDGHDHAAGAHAVLGSRPTAAPTVVVADPVVALGRLARHVVDVVDPVVLALTGSQGKTGTKDYLGAVLTTVLDGGRGSGLVVATAGNGNNEIGVPLTVLRATAATTHLVVEMGARGIGHVRELCDVAPPQVAAVLNVGSAHVGEFGSREAIAVAKGEIVEALPADGVAVLNAGDPLVAPMAARTAARVLTFGAREGTAGRGAADVAWSDVTLDELGRPAFRLHHAGRTAPVALRQVGGHQPANATAAAAMALAAGLDLDDVAHSLSAAEAASRWRMELTERADGLVVLNDAYNANPESVRAALRALVDVGAARKARGGRTVAVVGPMLELGDEHDAGHEAVGVAAADLGVDVVVVVGEEAAGIGRGAARGSDGACPPQVVPTAGRDEATAWVRHNATAADVVLVKASRGAALERVAEALLAQDGQHADDGGRSAR